MLAKGARCIECGARYPLGILYKCDRCGNILDIEYDYKEAANIVATRGLADKRETGIWQYRTFLPVADTVDAVTLGEGGTALFRCKRLSSRLGFDALYVKDETREPTGSFKDRPISVAITKALEFGVDTVVTSSSGNAGASVSAYAARAGLRCVVFVPSATPPGKLAQIAMYGAKVVPVEGSCSDTYRLAQITAKSNDWLNVTTTFLSPYSTEGDKTVGYEIAEQLDWQLVDWVIVPIGAGPLLVGIFKGFQELHKLGLISSLPRMVGVQAEGCSPIARAFEEGRNRVGAWIDKPETVATGIADPLVGYEDDGTYTLQIIRRSGGVAVTVSDDEILQAAVYLGGTEGLFAEPTGAASIAGARKLLDCGRIRRSDTVVCIVTGNGLKDTSAFSRFMRVPPAVIATEEGMIQVLKCVGVGEGDKRLP